MCNLGNVVWYGHSLYILVALEKPMLVRTSEMEWKAIASFILMLSQAMGNHSVKACADAGYQLPRLDESPNVT